MKLLKAIGKRIIFPSGVFLAFLVPFVAGGLFRVIVVGKQDHFALVTYLLAAYTVIVLHARIPSLVRFLISVQQNNAFVHQFTTDPFTRVKFSLPASIIFDIVYAFVQCILGLINMSFWFYVLVGYYIALAAMRLFLLMEFRPGIKVRRTSLQIRRFIGISLLLMNIALSAMVVYIVRFDRGFTTGWLFSLIMVSYTIGALITATVGLIKYRKLNSTALTVSKAVNFVAAAVSILVLETAIFDTFGLPLHMRRTVTAVTGAAVCLFTLVLALHLTLSKPKGEEAAEEEKQLQSATKQ